MKQLFIEDMLPSVMERNLWVRRPPAVQTASITVLCFRKQGPVIKRTWRSLWIAPSRIRRKKQNQAMKENMGMVLKEWTQRTLHQKNKLKVYCKVGLLLFCATAHYFFGCRRKSADALRYVISRHFWLSSQVWSFFFGAAWGFYLALCTDLLLLFHDFSFL